MEWTAGLGWLLGGLILVLASVVAMAFGRLRGRLAAIERELEDLRRRLDRTKRVEGSVPQGTPHAVAVPRGPRVRVGGEASRSEAVAVPTLISVPDLSVDTVIESGEPKAISTDQEILAFQQRFAEILELDESGLPVAEVSRISGLPVGQVELIVGLGRRIREDAGRSAPAR